MQFDGLSVPSGRPLLPSELLKSTPAHKSVTSGCGLPPRTATPSTLEAQHLHTCRSLPSKDPTSCPQGQPTSTRHSHEQQYDGQQFWALCVLEEWVGPDERALDLYQVFLPDVNLVAKGDTRSAALRDAQALLSSAVVASLPRSLPACSGLAAARSKMRAAQPFLQYAVVHHPQASREGEWVQVAVDLGAAPQHRQHKWAVREVEVSYRTFPAYMVRRGQDWYAEVPAFRVAACADSPQRVLAKAQAMAVWQARQAYLLYGNIRWPTPTPSSAAAQSQSQPSWRACSEAAASSAAAEDDEAEEEESGSGSDDDASSVADYSPWEVQEMEMEAEGSFSAMADALSKQSELAPSPTSILTRASHLSDDFTSVSLSSSGGGSPAEAFAATPPQSGAAAANEPLPSEMHGAVSTEQDSAVQEKEDSAAAQQAPELLANWLAACSILNDFPAPYRSLKVQVARPLAT